MKDKMRTFSVRFVSAMCGLALLGSSCSKEVFNDEDLTAWEERGVPNSLLSIGTRSGGDDETAPVYPVQLYVFDKDGKCVAVKTIADATAEVSLLLSEGTYDVYGIGGAEASRYELPGKDEAQTVSSIALRTDMVLDDLMTGHSRVTLTDGEENRLTLGLERKVMLIKNIDVLKVPSSTKAVSVTVSPLYESLLIDGSYNGTGGSHTFDLVQLTDKRTWKLSSETTLMPSVGKPSITVKVTDKDDRVKSYTYTAAEELTANHKVNIVGTYTEEIGITLEGTITGQAWEAEKTIRFEFNETGTQVAGETSGNDDSNSGGNDSGGENGGTNDARIAALKALSVGDVYEGCYVLAKSETSITLLSSKEEINIITGGTNEQLTIKDAIQSTLNSWNEISEDWSWAIPTEDEAITFLKNCSQINQTANAKINVGSYYYCINGTTIKSIYRTGNESAPFNTQTLLSFTPATILRPVATISLE